MGRFPVPHTPMNSYGQPCGKLKFSQKLEYSSGGLCVKSCQMSIKDISRCNVCLAKYEDLMHALIHCSHAKGFWEEAQALFEFRLPRLHPNTWQRDIYATPDSRVKTGRR